MTAGGPVLVLVTGAARSGTSTMAGTLHHLGLHVPGPFLESNESNPKGFYESRWAVRFHNRLIRRAGINVVDGRPDAFERVQAAVGDRARDRLAAYLAKHAAADQLVVKDPRTVWTQRLWGEAARSAGRRVAYVAMLRHPAEVVGSRSTYYSHYASGAGGDARRQATLDLTRWLNTSLVSERETRGAARAFVPYVDLLADWRATMTGVAGRLDLEFAVSPEQRPHPVDDFIDPTLRRHAASWDGVEALDDLRALADAAWDAQLALVADPADGSATRSLDEVGDRYRRLMTDALLLAQETVQEASRREPAAG